MCKTSHRRGRVLYKGKVKRNNRNRESRYPQTAKISLLFFTFTRCYKFSGVYKRRAKASRIVTIELRVCILPPRHFDVIPLPPRSREATKFRKKTLYYCTVPIVTAKNLDLFFLKALSVRIYVSPRQKLVNVAWR